MTPFEHNTYIITRSSANTEWYEAMLETLEYSFRLGLYQPAFRVIEGYSGRPYILGSLRAISNLKFFQSLPLNELLTYVKPYTGFMERLTFYIETNIGVAREIMRHRELSFTERSTRYAKSMEPRTTGARFDGTCAKSIETFDHLIARGTKRDEARELLPLGTATEFYMTMWPDQLDHFFHLREAKGAHEGARAVCRTMREDLLGLELRGLVAEVGAVNESNV
jgi:hypothetical protein